MDDNTLCVWTWARMMEMTRIYSCPCLVDGRMTWVRFDWGGIEIIRFSVN